MTTTRSFSRMSYFITKNEQFGSSNKEVPAASVFDDAIDQQLLDKGQVNLR